MFEFRKEKTPDLCKHNNNSALCELCKLPLEEAQTEANMIKGGMTMFPNTYREEEGEIGKMMKGAIDKNIVGNHIDVLHTKLVVGELVSSIESQIHKLQNELKKINEDHFSALEYASMSEEELNKRGIAWRFDKKGTRKSVLERIEKTKVE